MEDSHAAFWAGEYAVLRPEEQLRAIYQQHADIRAELKPYSLMPKNMPSFGGRRVKILNVLYYHFGWVLYEFEGLPGYWPEASIIDQQFLIKDGDAFNDPASETYLASSSADGEFVEIRHVISRRLYCSLRSAHVAQMTVNVNRVASLRSRFMFSKRYNFDGVESDEADDRLTSRDGCAPDDL